MVFIVAKSAKQDFPIIFCLFSFKHLVRQKMRKHYLFIFIGAFFSTTALAQLDSAEIYQYDTFFLAKKKGLLGQLGKSIASDPPRPSVTQSGSIKNDLPFNKYRGKIIRKINYLPLGLDRNINDTSLIKQNIGVRIADALHRTTTVQMLKNNLFVNEGDQLFPYLLADNERYLREQAYIQDARISVAEVAGSNDSVDVTVITKDVFSLGVNFDISSETRGRMEVYDENLFGHGERISINGLYDANRDPKLSFGAEFLKRNILGTFGDFKLGFQSYRGAFNNGANQDFVVYTRFERPLVSPYMPWTGAFEASYHKTSNAYNDVKYDSNSKYNYYDFDAWYGYNFGAKRLLRDNTESRLRKFLAIRAFHQQFITVPDKYNNVYFYQYANLTGVLLSFTLFQQDFYKTKFIYGFGRNEDVPEGFNLAVIGGWTNKQNRERPYYGLDFQRYRFSDKGHYFNYTFKLGGYFYDGSFEDIDLLLNMDVITRLKHLGGKWYTRNFLSAGFTHQIRPLLNVPLFLNSPFGLPEFNNGNIAADLRFTVKGETVVYNTWKLLGFRFAPFVFASGTLLTPRSATFWKSDIFTSMGAGLRTRNENLIFGTMELKAYFFPRRNIGMSDPWRIDFNTEVRFRYRSQFIKRPEFVDAN
jgi:hypothetical protein